MLTATPPSTESLRHSHPHLFEKPSLSPTTSVEPTAPDEQPAVTESLEPSVPVAVYLVRYGAVPEVARFRDASHATPSHATPSRGESVIVETHRGLQVGSVLEQLKPSLIAADMEIDFEIVRAATPADLQAARERTRECDESFAGWCDRIVEWDLEPSPVSIFGPDSTKLALQAAATGFGIIEVQPVSATGLVVVEKESGGCGTGGGGCGCSS